MNITRKGQAACIAAALLLAAFACSAYAKGARLMSHDGLINPVQDANRAPEGELSGAQPAEAAARLRAFAAAHPMSRYAVRNASAPLDFSIPVTGAVLKGKSGLDRALLSSPSSSRRSALPGSGFSGGQMAIVQFSRELSLDEKAAFFDTGAVFYRQLGQTSIAAFLTPSAAQKVSALAFVRWAGPYLDEYKYSASAGEGKNGLAMVYSFGPLKDEYRQELSAMGLAVSKTIPMLGAYEVALPKSGYPGVAALAWVRSIAPVRTPSASATTTFWPEDSRKLSGGPYVNSGVGGSSGFTGSGVTVGLYDTGINNSDTADFPSGSVDARSSFGDAVGHGTHVAGILAARGGRVIDSSHNARGMAPGASLYMINGVGGTSTTTYADAFARWQSAAVQLSNHSWGWISDYSYDDDTANIDLLTSTDTYPMVAVMAAGNYGDSGAATIANPATAKNVVSVGAIQYVEDYSSATYVLGARAPYSSMGPTSTATRLKPDLVAPGGMYSTDIVDLYGVVSVNSEVITSTNTWPSDYFYIKMSGTSMAAPHVTGALAYLLQMQQTFATRTEWAKAWLINSAIPITANAGGTSYTGYANTSVGYGLLEPVNMLYDVDGESEKITEHVSTLIQDVRNSEIWDIPIPTGAVRVAITMAYNDYPGDSIMTNLDMALRAPDRSDWTSGGGTALSDNYYWGGLPSGVTGESPVEKVILENPVVGNWKVKIYAKAWPSSVSVPSVRYAVVVKAYFATPALSISGATHRYAKPAGTVNIWQAVSNTAGGVAAGVSLKATSAAAFTGEMGQKHLVGNLVSSGTVDGSTFSFVAPAAEGSYTVRFTADELNLNPVSSYRDMNIEVVNDTSAPEGSILINGGATYSTSTVVTLTLSATDYQTGVTAMRISNDATNWSDWTAYSSSVTTSLLDGSGTRWIYAQFKDGVDNINDTPKSASIIVDMTNPAGSVNINGGAQYISTTSVTLSFVPIAGGSPVTYVRLGNDSPSDLGSYVPYASTMAWTLSAGDGVKGVYVQFKSAAGLESDVVGSSVTVITVPQGLTITLDKAPAPQGKRVVSILSPAQMQGTPVVQVTQYAEPSTTTLSLLMTNEDPWIWQGAYMVVPGYDGPMSVTATAIDLATNTVVQTSTFTVDTTSPTASIVFTSAQPAKSGPVTITMYGADATTMTPVSVAYGVTSSTLSFSFAMTALSTYSWSGTGYVNSFVMNDTATFSIALQDAAGNIGSVITSGANFRIDSRISGAAGGVYRMSDGTTVTMPAGAYSGDLYVSVSQPDAGRPDVQDSNTIGFYSAAVPGYNLNRELAAYDANTGLQVASFSQPMTLAIPYKDTNNTGYLDGTSIKATSLKLFFHSAHGWQMIKDTRVDTANKLILADLSHFSVYAPRTYTTESTFNDARAYPNPCKMKQFSLTLDHLPLDTANLVVKVYNLAGELVRTIDSSNGVDSYNTVTWDGRNNSGEKAASGTYIFVMTASNKATMNIKAAIIW